MESLKVGDVDIHKPLNAFIGAWKKDPANATDVGHKLAQMLKLLNTNGKTEL